MGIKKETPVKKAKAYESVKLSAVAYKKVKDYCDANGGLPYSRFFADAATEKVDRLEGKTKRT